MICNLQVKCKQCTQEMSFEAFKYHKDKCEFPCPFGCDCKITISSIKEHIPQNCPKCVNKCCYSEYGCPWCGPGGREYQDHLQNCKLAQLGPLYKMITALSTKMNEIDTKVGKMDSKMNEMKTEINQIGGRIESKMNQIDTKVKQNQAEIILKKEERREERRKKYKDMLEKNDKWGETL